MNGKYAEYADDRLNSLRRFRDRSRRWSTVSLLAAAALALLGILAAVDYCAVLPAAVRVGGVILTGAVVGTGLAWLLPRLRASSTAKDVALEVERRRPDLGCVLSTAAEYLPGGRAPRETYEPEMVAALQEYAARKLVVIETPWWRRQLLVCCGIAGAVALMLALALILVPGGDIAARRVLAPWRQLAYTTLQVKPGDIEVVDGVDQEIELVTSGKLLGAARLEWRPSQAGGWQKAAMRHVEPHRFLGTLPAVSGEVVYRVTGRDAHSPQFKLTSFTPPELKGARVRVTPPAYTKEAAREENAADLNVLRASRLDYRFLTTGSLTNARLRFANTPDIPLARGDACWTNSFVASRDAYYWVDLLDHKGRRGGNDKAFKLTVVQDEKPSVDITEPGLDIRAEPDSKVPLRISAADDYGVRDLRLVFRKMNGPWHTNRLALPKGEAKSVEAVVQLDLALLDLKQYEVAAYYAEAVDNNTLDGPGVGGSPVYFVEYTTKEQPLGQCRGGKATKVNLLEFEKQIIAATTALPDSGENGKYHDIAALQGQTKSYGLIFQQSPLLALAPEKARQEFKAALEAMDRASADLNNSARSAALASEEGALRHLYETCRLLPELEATMCRSEGACLKVVLEAIEKLKEQQKQERRGSLPQIIQEARRQIQEQQRLGENYSRAQQEQRQTNALVSNQLSGQPPQSQPQSQSQAQKTTKPGGGNGGAAETQRAEVTNSELGNQQRKLAEDAEALSRKLAEISGKDPRVSHRYSGMVQQTAELWIEAGNSLREGEVHTASLHAASGRALLQHVVDSLEAIYGETSPVGDMAVEEYPKEFEAQITEYLKRLSYAK